MSEMICDVITCCVGSCDMGTGVIMIENRKKTQRKYGKQTHVTKISISKTD